MTQNAVCLLRSYHANEQIAQEEDIKGVGCNAKIISDTRRCGSFSAEPVTTAPSDISAMRRKRTLRINLPCAAAPAAWRCWRDGPARPARPAF